MDQGGDSTASFGSNNSMATGDSTNVAMVGQTVVSDLMSSVGESPAQSSESVLEMIQRRDAQRGRGQDRSVHQNGTVVYHVLPKNPGSDGGSDGLGRGRSVLPPSLGGSPIGTRSRSPTPQRPSTMGRPESGRSSGLGTPSQIAATSRNLRTFYTETRCWPKFSV